MKRIERGRFALLGSVSALALLLSLPQSALAAKKKTAKSTAEAEAVASAPESAQVIRETALRREPFTDAEAVSTLAANTPVQLLLRQGAWVQVQTGEAQGWLRLLSLRTAAPAAPTGANGLQQALNVARTGASGNTVATGVRGLSKEDISKAAPNPAELEKLGRFAADETLARSFAAGGPLTTAEVPFLEKGDE